MCSTGEGSCFGGHVLVLTMLLYIVTETLNVSTQPLRLGGRAGGVFFLKPYLPHYDFSYLHVTKSDQAFQHLEVETSE